MTLNSRIPGLSPSHPANRLPAEALQRIFNAGEERDSILARAHATLHTKYKSKRRDMAFVEYVKQGKPAVKLAKAKLEAARVHLSAVAEELAAILSAVELWNTMQEEVSAASADYNLTGPQRAELWESLRMRARTAAIALASSQSVTLNPLDPTSSGTDVTLRRRGFSANKEDHMKIGNAVSQVGPDWRSRLNDVCMQLHSWGAVFPQNLATREGVDSWKELAETILGRGGSSTREAVRKYIEYRINWIRRNVPK